MPFPRIMIIAGPTAVGKTALALELAEDLGGEIISADSMQVYRHMNIGTAKPSLAERSRIQHHLLDVVDPDESFNAARFAATAASVIHALHAKRTPILIVGGTGLYLRALLGGLFPGPAADEDLRRYYREQQNIHGPGYLHRELARIDDLAARQLAPGDTVRIIRALEVMSLTGRSIVASQREHHFRDHHYDCLKIGLKMDRPSLYKRIEDRTQGMVNAGLVAEVRRLLAMGYGAGIKPMQSLGYKHVLSFLGGRIDLDEAIRLTARDTRRYAKRQETWFRADGEMIWYSPNESKEIRDRARRFLAGGNLETA